MNTPSLRVDIVRDISVLDLIAEQYEGLCSRADWINPYFSPEWMRAWWKRQKQDRSPLFLLAIGTEGSLLGYWPFIERPGLLGTKGLWPFIYDEANYHFPTCENRAASQLVGSLHGLLGSFLFAWVPQVPKRFWDEYMKGVVGRSPHFTIFRSERSSCMVEPKKDGSFDHFWEEKIGAKSRKSLRYDQGALARRGNITVEILIDFEEVRMAMPATCVVEVESRKTLENSGLYTIRGKRGFFFELLPELAKSSSVRVSFLRVDDQPIAWQLELLGPGNSYLHHIAYDEKWKKYSPGKQLLKDCMERCWEEGRVLDFLPAPFAYKQAYANASMPVHELHLIKRSVRGRIAAKLIRWNMNWRKKMRERSPGLAATVARDQVTRANSGFSK